jgi:hypothetical protein
VGRCELNPSVSGQESEAGYCEPSASVTDGGFLDYLRAC